MKSLADAMALRNHVIDIFEHADLETDSAMRRSMLSFVVAGGGFAGTETVAELHDFAHTARRFYSNIDPSEVSVTLVHSGNRIMPEIGPDLAEYALRKLRSRGIEVLLNTRVASASGTWVQLSNGRRIDTKTLVWTAGAAPHPLLETLPCPRSERGQVRVNGFLEVPGYQGVWALGDGAEVPNHAGLPSPPTAQNAIRQGELLAANIAAVINGKPMKRFDYKPLGMLSSLGRRSAVAEIGGIRFSGFVAWWLWRTIYLSKLPGLERKVRVALDWTLELFFPRDIVLLKSFKKTTEAAAPVGTEETDINPAMAGSPR
jgi:NADH dehydrogenase